MVKKDTRKNQRVGKINGHTITQTLDFSDVTKDYKKWKEDCKSMTGPQMGVKNIGNLLQAVKNHGVPEMQRPESSLTFKPMENGKDIINFLDKQLDPNTSEIVDAEVDMELTDILERLEQMEKSGANPRNIVFNVPDMDAVDPDTAVYDEEEDVTTVYGHYRTEDYVEYRNLKARVKDNDKYRETISPNKTYYNTEKNQAKPPLWQAFYSGDGETGDDIKKGLVVILKSTKKKLDDGELTVEVTLRGVPRGGLANDIMNSLPQVRDFFNDAVSNPKNAQFVNQKTGNFRDDFVQRLLQNRFSFTVQPKSIEGKAVERLFGLDEESLDEEAPLGDVKGYTLNITRTMVKNLAMETGKCRRRSAKGPIYLTEFTQETPKKTKKKTTDKKGFKKSWNEILKVN